MTSDRSSARAGELWPDHQGLRADPSPMANDSPAFPAADTVRAARITQAQVDRVRQVLSERDQDVVASVAQLRLVTGAQLRRLHVTGGTPLGNARVTRAMLARLVSLRVLARLDRRIGGVRSGSDGYVYGLDVIGQRLNGGMGPAGGHRARRPWTPSYPFTDHILDVAELYVRLVEAARSEQLELLEFVAEPACWRSYVAPSGGHAILKPDAYARTATSEFELSWFLEVDRATESLATLARKCSAYRAHWACGREQHQRGVYPRVLWLVPDEARLALILEVLGAQPPESWKLFQATTYEQAVTVLGGGRA
jgi:hypothetical protein